MPTPKLTKGVNASFDQFKLTPMITGQRDLFVPNRAKRRLKRQRNLENSLQHEDLDTKRFCRPANKIADKGQRSLVVVVTNDLNGFLDRHQASLVPPSTRRTLCVGSMVSAKSYKNPTQDFFTLHPEKFDQLSNTYIEGLDIGVDDRYSLIDDVVKEFAMGNLSLVSLDKIVPESELSSGKYFHHVRTFAGDGSPTVDSTFKTLNNVPGLHIHFKMVDSRDYSEYPPLSTGFFNAPSHGIQIQEFYMPIINMALGRQGTYVGGRSVMVHTGQLSYCGPRKDGKMRQPTVAEGPNESGVEPESKFWYHRKFISHSYWPFAHGLINHIVGSTTLAAYYLYRHMACFYPISNSSDYRKKFCPRGILAIDFSSSCHVDRGDDQKFCEKSMVGKLRKVLQRFQELQKQGVSCLSSRVDEITNCLKHVTWWGVCLPTTCCYQYISKRTDIEVYQWFLCPGLGTTHRIKNYWVHLFLASLFSHCTSAPIYIVNGRAYFGRCPQVTMFSWGGV